MIQVQWPHKCLKLVRGSRSRPCALQSINKNIFIKHSLIPGASNKSHNNGCIVINMITTTIKLKVMTVTHRHHCKANNSVTVAFL